MTTLSSVSTILPQHNVDTEDLKQVSASWLAGDNSAQQKFLRISDHSGVDTRKFALPYDQILALNGMQYRAQQFEECGTRMLTDALERTLTEHDQNPDEIGALVFTSCSVPIIPSIDAAVILSSSLPNNISRVPIYQHGCAGGVVGLALGAKLSTLGKPVIVSSVELCSLVFQPKNHSGSHLVGAAIFADGAAATIVSPHAGKLSILGSESQLIPNSRHLMGYDIFDDGFHLRLDRALPSKLIEHAPNILNRFLHTHGKTPKNVDYWLFHPGGIKILNFLRDTFFLSHEQCCWSYDVLREHGNLSSATILYVLNAFIRDDALKAGQTALVMGIGPGLTIEMILIEGSRD